MVGAEPVRGRARWDVGPQLERSVVPAIRYQCVARTGLHVGQTGGIGIHFRIQEANRYFHASREAVAATEFRIRANVLEVDARFRSAQRGAGSRGSREAAALGVEEFRPVRAVIVVGSIVAQAEAIADRCGIDVTARAAEGDAFAAGRRGLRLAQAGSLGRLRRLLLGGLRRLGLGPLRSLGGLGLGWDLGRGHPAARIGTLKKDWGTGAALGW